VVTDLELTQADVLAALDEAYHRDMPPLDEDPAHLTVKDIVARYPDLTESKVTRWLSDLVERGEWQCELRRRRISNGRIMPVMLYWPVGE
jgi:hypothetical protein